MIKLKFKFWDSNNIIKFCCDPFLEDEIQFKIYNSKRSNTICTKLIFGNKNVLSVKILRYVSF